MLDDGMDIAEYAFIKHIYLQIEDNSSKNLRFTASDGTAYSIPYQAFNTYAGTLFDTYGERYYDDLTLPPYPIAENIDFVPFRINFDYDGSSNKLRNLSVEGYLLCR